MKKQKIQMIVLLVILGAAIAAYFGFRAWKQKQDDAENQTYTAYSVDQDDITGIECHNDAGSFAISRDSSKGNWTFDDEPDETVDATQADNLAKKLSEISSDHEVNDVTKPEDYGFGDDPTITIQITRKDGTTDTLYVGSENSTISEYYFRVGDSDTIYTVSTDFVNAFNVDQPSLVSKSASSSSSADQPTEAVSADSSLSSKS